MLSELEEVLIDKDNNLEAETLSWKFAILITSSRSVGDCSLPPMLHGVEWGAVPTQTEPYYTGCFIDTVGYWRGCSVS